VRKGHPTYYCDLKDSNCTRYLRRKLKKEVVFEHIWYESSCVSMNLVMKNSRLNYEITGITELN
jgi:hypothetical protein